MKEITILSGKGGTGKTSITAALASVVDQAVFCDNDVDAADLHLILQPKIKEENTFFSGWSASINQSKCTQCGICAEYCRFDAISSNALGELSINPLKCEGCRLCERVCPEQAITSKRNDNNFWYVSDTRLGTLVHAKMGPGEENSGKLVAQVRKRAKEIAIETNAKFILNDGPPGIGCATISSITGTNAVLIVTEPTKSGLHDAARLVELIRTFQIPIYALINKYDINLEMTNTIQAYFKSENIPLLAKIPFDKEMVEAMIEGKTIIEYNANSKVSKALMSVIQKIKEDE
jgi:MinD superfamily P-loop ATPase